MFFGYLALATSIVLTCIAGYFSVHGMIALFAANAIGVAVMMTCLEAAKVVTAGWLKLNWTSRTVPLLHKAYLTIATVILMVLTSIGIYGYLSAGHLEQQAPMAGIELQSGGLERQIAVKDAEVKRIETRLAQIDKNIDTFLNSDKATAGLRASNSLKGERDKLQKTLDERNVEINALNEKLTPLKQQSSEVEAKLGPIKYVAALFGMTNPESAVRIVIMMIMAVFDPLAIVLMISGLISISQRKKVTAAAEPEQEFSWTKEFAPRPDLPAAAVSGPEHEEPATPLEEAPASAEEAPEAPDAAMDDEPVESVVPVAAEPHAVVPEGKIVVVDDGHSRVIYPAPEVTQPDEVVLDPEDVRAAQAVIAAFEKPVAQEPASDQYEIVDDEVVPVLDDTSADTSLMLELERDRDASEQAVIEPALTHEDVQVDQREKLIRLLEEHPDFLLEVAQAITDIQREQVEKRNGMIHGGGTLPTEVTKLGADFQ